jgi:hypothetical protein
MYSLASHIAVVGASVAAYRAKTARASRAAAPYGGGSASRAPGRPAASASGASTQ